MRTAEEVAQELWGPIATQGDDRRYIAIMTKTVSADRLSVFAAVREAAAKAVEEHCECERDGITGAIVFNVSCWYCRSAREIRALSPEDVL